MKVYVSTYAKYNKGSLKGDWIDLEGHDQETFLAACRELHAEEVDPEFMFQSWEGVPEPLISESSLHEELWEFIELHDDRREIVSAYWECTGCVTPIREALDAYVGKYESPEDFSEQYCDEHYSESLNGLPSWMVQSIDWRNIWTGTLQYDFTEGNGFFFLRE